jgi:hypothetical protein
MVLSRQEEMQRDCRSDACEFNFETACFLDHLTHVSIEQSRKEVDDTETYSIATLIEMQVEEWNELKTSCLDSAREAYSAGSSGILHHSRCHICHVNYPKKFTKARIN